METTICFLNDKIIALSGKATNKNVFVNAYKIFELSEGSIINGVITDAYSIKDVLKSIKSDKRLFFKGKIHVIIDSSLIYIKPASFPLSSTSKMNVFVEGEFVGIDKSNTEYLFDYSIIKWGAKKAPTITCYAVERSLLKAFMELFEEEKIQISSINISTNCISKITSKLTGLDNKTYVIANIDKNNISLLLYVNNSFYYSTRARLLNDYATEGFYQEIASNISSINQFNKSQRNGFEIQNVYLCGMSDVENMSCTGFINDLGIENSSTILFNSFINYSNKIKSFNVTDLLINIGCLIRK